MSLTIPVGEHDHIQGDSDAAVTLVEYGDYQCPYCGQAYPIVKAVQERLGSKLRFVFRNMPLKEIHRHAEIAAEAAEAAGDQGKFWEMHDALFENQAHLELDHIRSLAEGLGLDIARFDEDLSSHKFQERVRADFMSGVRSGVAGTPTFFINGERLESSWDEESLLAALS